MLRIEVRGAIGLDPLSALFLGCFVFGFAAVTLSFLLGGLHGFDVGGHGLHVGDGGVDLGGHHLGVPGPHGHVAAAGAHGGVHQAGGAYGGTRSGLFPLNPTTLLAFLTWFGGSGFILREYYGLAAPLSVAGGVGVGLLGAALVFLFLLKVLLPSQTDVMHEADYQPLGSVGRISATIRTGGVGEVVYTRGGTRRTVGARSLDGQALERGTEVVIAKYERGLAYVQPWEEFVSRERRTAAEG